MRRYRVKCRGRQCEEMQAEWRTEVVNENGVRAGRCGVVVNGSVAKQQQCTTNLMSPAEVVLRVVNTVERTRRSAKNAVAGTANPETTKPVKPQEGKMYRVLVHDVWCGNGRRDASFATPSDKQC